MIVITLISPIYCNFDVEPPTRCESCVIFVRELEREASRIYERSEAAAIELLENVCQRVLEYKIHKNKAGIKRFSREESTTMNTLKKLKERGVKVDLGMPYEMWDYPSAEITELRQHCELIISEYEDELIQWFISPDRLSLQGFLCASKILHSPSDRSCLTSATRDEL